VNEKARSEVLKAKQNELIVCRYYYFIKVEERQYEKTLDLLENEIFLSKRTIIDIIAQTTNLLAQPAHHKTRYKIFSQQVPAHCLVAKSN
jgi:hypothetical protein